MRFGNLPRSCLCFCNASPLKGNLFFGTLFGRRRRSVGRSSSSFGRRRRSLSGVVLPGSTGEAVFNISATYIVKVRCCRCRSAVGRLFGRRSVVVVVRSLAVDRSAVGRRLGNPFFPWLLARLAETQLRGNLQACRGRYSAGTGLPAAL